MIIRHLAILNTALRSGD